MTQGNYSEALEHHTIILRNEPDNTDANYNSGVIYSRTGHYDKAVPRYVKTIQTDPDFINAYIALAEVYVKQNKPEKAIDVYQRALKETHKIPVKLYFNLSIVLKRLNRIDESEINLLTLLGKKPSHIGGNLLYGDILLERQDYQKALLYFNRAAKNDVSSAEALNGIGITNSKLGNYDKAVRAFQKAIQINPKMEKAHLNLQHTLSEKFSNMSKDGT